MGTRVKTDDPEFERACSMADALSAARLPLHKGWRLGAIIDALSAAKPDAAVEYDFGGFNVTGIDSYRGYYEDLALSFGNEGALNAGALLAMLRGADGKMFDGYKGGEYRMNRDTPVWVANWGCSHGVAVVGVEDQGWRVLVRTALID